MDSNVFISIVQSDFGRNFEFMDLRSSQFLEKVFDCKYDIVISNLVIREFSKITKTDETKLFEFFKRYWHKIRVIKTVKEDIRHAKFLKKDIVNGFSDSLHASVALRENCDIICTWNVKDFLKLESNYKIKIRKPSDL